MIPLTEQILTATINTNTVIALMITVIILLFISAFFSASEMAFSTINSIRLRKFADDNVKGARTAIKIIDNYERTISSILVGNNLVNIANTTICAYLFGMLIINPTLSNILNTIIMTIIILIFGEILPKSFAKINSEKFALKYSKTLLVSMKILWPIVAPFYYVQKAMTRKAKENINTPTVTEDDLEGIIDAMEEEGVIKSEDADLFMGVLDINEKKVYDIMTPRVDVVAVEINDKIEDVIQLFIKNGYSRIPVYKEDKDHMIGILNYKDFFSAYFNKDRDMKVADLITGTIFISENMTVKELIRTMQKQQKHLAIVVDEHGGTSGIVTMEDALEEMVGEIYDEHDEIESLTGIIKISENTYEFSPDLEVSDLFEFLEIEHLPKTEYSTMGGYLYELADNLPEPNQVLETIVYDEQPNDEGEYITKKVRLTFVITKMDNNRIIAVQLKVQTLKDED